MNKENKHKDDWTKEPWEVRINPTEFRGRPQIVMAETGGFISTINGQYLEPNEANARRIVACVNACAGIPINHNKEKE